MAALEPAPEAHRPLEPAHKLPAVAVPNKLLHTPAHPTNSALANKLVDTNSDATAAHSPLLREALRNNRTRILLR